ncbi:MAG: glycosyltransferase family 39 protein [Candidatus Omnitrophota bacterium]|nr:glycosyltransferase family 39 protein [Candidatus Omnitrophota bacterium]
MAGLLFYHRVYLARLFRNLNRRDLAFLSIIILSAAILRFMVIPHMHYVYYDEFHFMNVAQNMYYHNNPGSTLIGDKLHPEFISGDIRPGGYSFLISLFIRLFGDSQSVPFYMNSFFGTVSVLLVFIVAFLLLGDAKVGLWSALVFSLTPLHLKYSGSGSSDISALCFILLLVSVALLYARYKRKSLLYLLSSVLVYSSYIRPENAFLFIPFLFALFIELKKSRVEKGQVLNIIYFSVILLVPLLARVPQMLQTERNSAGGVFWSFGHFLENAPDNIKYLFSVKYNLILAAVFFLLGSAQLFIRRRGLFYLLIGWFAAFFLIYSFFFGGDFLPEKTIDSERHFLLCLLPFSIISGYGINRALAYFFRARFLYVAFAVALCAALVLNCRHAFVHSSREMKGMKSFKESEFIKRVGDKLPADIYILDYNAPYFISGFNKKAVNSHALFSSGFFPEQLILFKGYWWHRLKDSSAEKEIFLKGLYDFELLQETEIAPGLNYSFEKLKLKADVKRSLGKICE